MKSGEPYSMHRARFSRWVASSVEPTTQPIRQPVMACDFDRLLRVAVRSAMPGRLPGLTCSPSYNSSLYTSSEISHRSWAMHSSASASQVARGRLAPEGLCGLFRARARVRGVMRAATSRGHTRKPFSGLTGTGTTLAPQAPNTAS
ncbi:hypothetical protein D3C75_698870 [compost metagenome]